MTSEQQELANTPRWLQLWRSQRENVQIVAIALVLALSIRLFVAEPRYIPSDSMAPTLAIGDRLVVEKVSYYWREPKPGEIVVFNPPETLQDLGYQDNQAFIKRAIAHSGQTVAIRDGTVYVNGQPLAEAYIKAPPNYERRPRIVPEGAIYVLGDNRNNSNDSHVWGVLPEDKIIGRAWFRFWPLDRVGFVQTPNLDPLPPPASTRGTDDWRLVNSN